MANEQSPMQTTLDAPQVLQNSHHQAIGVLKVMSGFLAGEVGRKIEREVMSATVDRFHFTQDATLFMTYEVTYSNAAHDDINVAERIA
jgi:hypothetical protein